MRLQGLCAQEIRDSISLDTISGLSTTDPPVSSRESGGLAPSTRVSGDLLKILQGFEEKLLDKYYAMRDSGANIRRILQYFSNYAHNASRIEIGGDAPGILRDMQQGRSLQLEEGMPFKESLLNDLSSWTGSNSMGGVFHYAVYFSRADTIPSLLLLGIPGIDHMAGQLGLTALHVAAMKGDLNCVMALLNGGVRANCKASGTLGYITPLELAVSWCPEDSVGAIVEALLASMDGIETYQERLLSRVGCKTTLLHMAAARHSSAVLFTLLSRYELGSEFLNIRDIYYRTVLHIATQHGCFKSVKFLIQKGANIQARDCHGLTPQELAMARLSSLETTGKPRPLRARSDNLYDVLTYGRNLNPSSADNEAIIQEFNNHVAQELGQIALQGSLLFQFPFQLKHYEASKKVAFASPKRQQPMTDYFATEATSETETHSRTYTYSNTAICIPGEPRTLHLLEYVCPVYSHPT